MHFRDRRHAGRLLATQLMALAGKRPVIVALPRGGVPVGFEVAAALDAPLDILAVRKIGAPGNPEFGVGAIAEDGTAVLNAQTAGRSGMTQSLLEATVQRELIELRRRMKRYRNGRAPIDVRGRTVIVVDDGLATGLTVVAAVRALRARGAASIVVAVPVGAPDSIALVGEEADEVVCHTIPHDLIGVGRWYEDFRPVADDEVVELLEAAVTAAEAPRAPTAPARASRPQAPGPARTLQLDVGSATLIGDLSLPAAEPHGLIIFAHGSGSSRLSPRNRAVAATLNDAGFATLLYDLLSEREARDRALVFDIPLLARRLELVTRAVLDDPALAALPIGYFGASTGAAAALRAAAAVGDVVQAVVSRGGRPDLAADRLPHVSAPTLLIVGSRDREVLELNRRAGAMLRCPHRLLVVDGATHLFEEPGTLETVAQLATQWFEEHLRAVVAQPAALGR